LTNRPFAIGNPVSPTHIVVYHKPLYFASVFLNFFKILFRSIKGTIDKTK